MKTPPNTSKLVEAKNNTLVFDQVTPLEDVARLMAWVYQKVIENRAIPGRAYVVNSTDTPPLRSYAIHITTQQVQGCLAEIFGGEQESNQYHWIMNDWCPNGMRATIKEYRDRALYALNHRIFTPWIGQPIPHGLPEEQQTPQIPSYKPPSKEVIPDSKAVSALLEYCDHHPEIFKELLIKYPSTATTEYTDALKNCHDLEAIDAFQQYNILNLLQAIPPKVFNEYACRTLKNWYYLGYFAFGLGKIYYYETHQMADDPELLTILNPAIALLRLPSAYRNANTITFMQDLYAQLSTIIDGIDLNAILKESGMSEKRHRHYSIEATWPMVLPPTGARYIENWYNREQNGKWYSISMDSPFGFILKYKNGPIASTSFYPVDTESLLINQVQGVRPFARAQKSYELEENVPRLKTKGLEVFDWRKCMVRICEEIAGQMGLLRTIILSGFNNSWVSDLYYNGKQHLPTENAMHYDETAHRLGYHRIKDDIIFFNIQNRKPEGNFHKEISHSK